MGLLYAKDSKIFASDYLELYIPKEYFESNCAKNKGASIESFGVVYIRSFKDGTPGKLQYLNLPVIINFMVYEFRDDVVSVNGRSIDVMALQYAKDTFVFRQSITKGREVAELFLANEMDAKLPGTLNYADIMDMWWTNLEMSGVNFKVPSKIHEMIVATTYRNPHNLKKRYGQLYGQQTNPTGTDYVKSDTRRVVRDLSTFSGMVFEDMGQMISSGISNSINGLEEPISPLEKIIHY